MGKNYNIFRVIMVLEKPFFSSLNFKITLEATETQREEKQKGGRRMSFWALELGCPEFGAWLDGDEL